DDGSLLHRRAGCEEDGAGILLPIASASEVRRWRDHGVCVDNVTDGGNASTKLLRHCLCFGQVPLHAGESGLISFAVRHFVAPLWVAAIKLWQHLPIASHSLLPRT